MRILTVISLLLMTFLRSNAQECPPEWLKYTYSGYIYAIESDVNDRHVSESEFKNKLLNNARANLAKQVSISVKETSTLDKSAINGRSATRYSSSSLFSTDVDLKLVETRTLYDAAARKAYAIAFISRKRALDFYNNELSILKKKISGSLELTDNYIATGRKNEAKSELELTSGMLKEADNSLFWINVFGASQTDLDRWSSSISFATQNVNQSLARLKNGTRIYLSCKADILGNPYPTLQNELKGAISNESYSFVSHPDDADWSVRISASVTEKRIVDTENSKFYFCYVNASIEITNAATGKTVYEDEISVKGGHTVGYTHAAKKACKEIKEKLASKINQTITQ